MRVSCRVHIQIYHTWTPYRDLGKYLGTPGSKLADGDWGVWNCLEGGLTVPPCERLVKASSHATSAMSVGLISVAGTILTRSQSILLVVVGPGINSRALASIQWLLTFWSVVYAPIQSRSWLRFSTPVLRILMGLFMHPYFTF